MNKGTPLHFDLLMWYHCRSGPWDGPKTETSDGFTEDLLQAGLIRPRNEDAGGYQTTTHGKRVVEELCEHLSCHF